jgi:hypothetical protein
MNWPGPPACGSRTKINSAAATKKPADNTLMGSLVRMVCYPTVEAHVPAPAKISTKPRKMAASIVEKVQGLRMWITPGTDQNSPKH